MKTVTTAIYGWMDGWIDLIAKSIMLEFPGDLVFKDLGLSLLWLGFNMIWVWSKNLKIKH